MIKFKVTTDTAEYFVFDNSTKYKRTELMKLPVSFLRNIFGRDAKNIIWLLKSKGELK